MCVLITLNVKNAFDCAKRVAISDNLGRADAPRCLTKIISQYLADRKIIQGDGEMTASADVPGGSILGLVPWRVCMTGS